MSHQINEDGKGKDKGENGSEEHQQQDLTVRG